MSRIKVIRRAFSRAVSRLLTAVNHLSRGMLTAVRKLTRRLEDLWEEFQLSLRDLWFRVSLLAEDMGKILLFLAPGLILLLISILGGGVLWGVLGGIYCVGLIIAAVKFGSDDGPVTEGEFAHLWAVHFPPTWWEDKALVATIQPILDSYHNAERALQSALRSASKDDPFNLFLKRIVREMRKRMHNVRSYVRAAKRSVGRRARWDKVREARAGNSEWSSLLEGTGPLFSSIQKTVLALNNVFSSQEVANGAFQFPTPDNLGESLQALEELLSNIEGLKKHPTAKDERLERELAELERTVEESASARTEDLSARPEQP